DIWRPMPAYAATGGSSAGAHEPRAGPEVRRVASVACQEECPAGATMPHPRRADEACLGYATHARRVVRDPWGFPQHRRLRGGADSGYALGSLVPPVRP